MVPEFASNVAHCDNILVSLIRLRPRVKLSTRTTHILCSSRLPHLVFKMWHVRTLDALVREYDCEQDTADEVPPGMEYSSGEDSDMEDMGEEMGSFSLWAKNPLLFEVVKLRECNPQLIGDCADPYSPRGSTEMLST